MHSSYHPMHPKLRLRQLPDGPRFAFAQDSLIAGKFLTQLLSASRATWRDSPPAQTEDEKTQEIFMIHFYLLCGGAKSLR